MRNRVPQRADARWRFRLLSSVAIYAMAVNALAPLAAFAAPASMSNANDANTATPIKHVIVIIGENRTFDHLFATYKPVNKGEKVLNLLSEGIVQANGFPGPNYAAATQWHAQDTTTYQLSPGVKIPYKTLVWRFRCQGCWCGSPDIILWTEGSLPLGAITRTATLYSVGPVRSGP
jgi:phospholipase C